MIAVTTVPPSIVVPSGPNFDILNRSSTITVGTTQIQNIGQQRGLDVEFEVKSTLKPKEPNTCDLKIWNLSEGTRKAIEQASQPLKGITAPPKGTAKVVPVQIVAGYLGHTSTIFLGEMRSAQTVTDGPNLVTELNTGDGDDALVLQRINVALPAGTTASKAIQALLGQMGCGLGNLMSSNVQGALAASSAFQGGAVLKGNAADRIANLCASVGLEFSLQGGQAQFLPLGQPLGGQAYKLSPSTGLVGSPTVDTKGVLSCVAFILPGLVCGGPIDLDSENAQGLYRIVSITYKGATAGAEWYAQIEALRYGQSIS